MDTRWKKSKAAGSFLAFAAGLTTLVIQLVPAASMASAFGVDVFAGQADYQESGDFRILISNRLSDLLGVATGGRICGISPGFHGSGIQVYG